LPARIEELKQNGSTQADIYGLRELDGLGMVYILELGLEDSKANYALPEDPEVPTTANLWGTIFSPLRSVLVVALLFALWVNKGESVAGKD